MFGWRHHGRRHPHDGGRAQHGPGPGRHPQAASAYAREKVGRGRSRRNRRRDPGTRPVRLTPSVRHVGHGVEDVSMSYPLTHSTGIDADVAQTLQVARHPHHRAAARSGQESRKAASVLAAKTGIEPSNAAALRQHGRPHAHQGHGPGLCRAAARRSASIPCGNCKYRNPANLAKAMADANNKRKLVRLLPSEKVVGALDRARQEAAAQDHLLSSTLVRATGGLTPSPPCARKAQRHDAISQRHAATAMRGGQAASRRCWPRTARWSWACST